MSVYHITYRDGHKVAVPVNKEEYIQIRNGAKNIANLGMARKGNQYAKRSLEQFNYSCYPNTDGTLKGATKVSETCAMDIDHIEDLKTLVSGILAKAEELQIYMVEKTASGNGLHVVFKRMPSLSNEENIKRMAEQLGVEPDMQAKDITRVFFTTTASKNELLLLKDELFADNGLTAKEKKPLSPNPFPPTASLGARGVDTAENKGSMAEGVSDEYNGIPYSKIIETWWKMFYGGETPTQNNRNTLTYELALNLRHICGFSEAQLRHIIPCYDGFSEEERNQCIASAVSSRKTMMPYRMKTVLDHLKKVNINDIEVLAQLDETTADNDSYYEKQLPALPMGLNESVAQSGAGLAFPAIFTVATIAGFFATKVKLAVHGVAKGLNILSFVVGESGSGKSCCTRIFKAWTKTTQEAIDEFYEKEAEWAAQRRTKLSGKVENAPKSTVRIITLNNTSANVAERLEAVKGIHSLSYTSEADIVYGKWSSDMETLSSMLRVAWDEDRFDREAKSADAARCHIPKLLWNVLMCGTPDALYRLITNVTDGFMNRFAIAKTPDNTFTPYEVGSEIGFRSDDIPKIDFLVECLQLMQGTLESRTLEEWTLQWIEQLRIEALKQGADRVLARMRIRTPTTAARVMVASYILPRTVAEMLRFYKNEKSVKQALADNAECWLVFADRCFDDDAHQYFTTVCDYMVDTYLYYFGQELTNAYNDTKYNRGSNIAYSGNKSEKKNVYDILPSEFGIDDLVQANLQLRKNMIKRQSAYNMVANWKLQGLITEGTKRGLYRKKRKEVENGSDSNMQSKRTGDEIQP